MSHRESEIRNYILTKLLADIEKQVSEEDFERIILEELNEEDINIENIISRLNLQGLEDDLYDKYSNIKNINNQNGHSWTTFSSLDYGNYDQIVDHLEPNKNLSVKLKAVRKLLNFQFIEVNDSWSKLSRNLQNCLMHTNKDLFLLSLKVHYKIITFQDSCSEGYLSLVQGLEYILNNRSILNKQQTELTNKLHGRIKQILKVLLKTQRLLIKCIPAKQKLVEESVGIFINLLCNGQEESVLVEFLSVLDSKAAWFGVLCYKTQLRKFVLKKIPNFIKYSVSVFLQKLNECINLNKNSARYKSNVCKLSHTVHFLNELLKYELSQVCFPLKINGISSDVSVEFLILESISKLKAFHTNNEVRKLLIQILKLTNFYNHVIINALIEPLNLCAFERTHTGCTFDTNEYILDILNELAVCKNKQILFRSKNTYHILKIVNEISIYHIKNYISNSETDHQIKEIVFKLLHCCKNLYSLPNAFTVCTPDKVLTALEDFYKASENYNVNLYYKLDFMDLFSFFLINYPPCRSKICADHMFVQDILNFVLLNQNLKSKAPFLVWIIGKNASDVIKGNHNLIISSHLEAVWLAEEQELNVVKETDDVVEREICKLLRLVNIFSTCYCTFEALFAYENEGTIMDNESKPSTLAELIECTLLSSNDDFYSSYVSLMVLRILITNANVAVHLENSLKLQENLNSVQDSLTDIKHKFNTTAVVVDTLSTLRYNIIRSLKYFGSVDQNLYSGVLNETQLPTSVSQSSTTIRRREKTQTQLQKFLHDSKVGPHDHNWMLQARRLFKVYCGSLHKVSVLVDLIEQIPKPKKSNQDPRLERSNSALLPQDYTGITVIIRYGVQTGLLTLTSHCEENLIQLYKQLKRVNGNSCGDSFCNFNWLLGVVFLMCSGNTERTKNVYLHFGNFQVFTVLQGPDADSPALLKFYTKISAILEETTEIHSALNILGMTAEIFVKKWLNQCFFNMLPFEEICNFVGFSALFPLDYVVYFVVALFDHMKFAIFAAAHENNFKHFLNLWYASDFSIHRYFTFMDDLAKKYKNSVI